MKRHVGGPLDGRVIELGGLRGSRLYYPQALTNGRYRSAIYRAVGDEMWFVGYDIPLPGDEPALSIPERTEAPL